MNRLNRFGVAFIMPALAWQVAFFVFPMLFLIALTFWRVELFRLQPDFSWENWQKIYSRWYFWRALLSTAGFATLTAFAASVLAFPLACWTVFGLSAKWRRVVIIFLVAPFFTSYLVRIYSWQIYLGDNGVINSAITSLGIGTLPLLNSPIGLMIGYLTLTLPLTTLLQIFGLTYFNHDLLKAAQNLGSSFLRSIFLIAIPSAKPALVVAALFSFILVFGDFASPVYLGGATIPTTTTLIVDLTKGGQQWPQAAVVALTVILLLLTLTLGGLRYAYRSR